MLAIIILTTVSCFVSVVAFASHSMLHFYSQLYSGRQLYCIDTIRVLLLSSLVARALLKPSGVLVSRCVQYVRLIIFTEVSCFVSVVAFASHSMPHFFLQLYSGRQLYCIDTIRVLLLSSLVARALLKPSGVLVSRCVQYVRLIIFTEVSCFVSVVAFASHSMPHFFLQLYSGRQLYCIDTIRVLLLSSLVARALLKPSGVLVSRCVQYVRIIIFTEVSCFVSVVAFASHSMPHFYLQLYSGRQLYCIDTIRVLLLSSLVAQALLKPSGVLVSSMLAVCSMLVGFLFHISGATDLFSASRCKAIPDIHFSKDWRFQKTIMTIWRVRYLAAWFGRMWFEATGKICGERQR